VEIGGFWVVFEYPHFQAKKGIEKSRGKIKKKKNILGAVRREHKHYPGLKETL